IGTKCNRSAYFLTRASVFNKPVIAKILESLQMLPVYRIRDGWGNLENNNAIFESCSKLLNNNECIVIFPEGNHSLERTVRPFSKGFTRIVLDTLESYPELDLQLLPVGLNFVKAENFPDSASIYFGKPISAKNYISENKNDDVVRLKTKLQAEIGALTTHIPKANYQDNLNNLERLNVDFLNPKAVNKCMANQFQDCNSINTNSNSFYRPVFKILFIIAFILPYLVWKFVAKPKIKEIEFRSTFRFAMAITLAPLWLIMVCVTLAILFGWKVAVVYLITSLIITLLAVKL
ncbi:1-acyl-sn-glycerol-3-phosphate acyltransferase, partial [Algibacter sp.]|uniref:1-acyl-sn-glycerol-3-phosphate acyltransferase n=1 Tax=Algibacter sp. TaxID=1872428 RepID=UPI003C717E9B